MHLTYARCDLGAENGETDWKRGTRGGPILWHLGHEERKRFLYTTTTEMTTKSTRKGKGRKVLVTIDERV